MTKECIVVDKVRDPMEVENVAGRRLSEHIRSVLAAISVSPGARSNAVPCMRRAIFSSPRTNAPRNSGRCSANRAESDIRFSDGVIGDSTLHLSMPIRGLSWARHAGQHGRLREESDFNRV